MTRLGIGNDFAFQRALNDYVRAAIAFEAMDKDVDEASPEFKEQLASFQAGMDTVLEVQAGRIPQVRNHWRTGVARVHMSGSRVILLRPFENLRD